MAIADVSRLLDLQAIQAERYKRSLKAFIVASWHIVEPAPFVDGYVVDALVEHLEAVTSGQIRKLVINIPPRHSKSTLISVIWPVWDWLQIPEDKFLCASYSLDLSTRDNRRKRMLIESPWFQERYASHFSLMPDQNQKRFFENDKQGYHMAVSVDGATTGQGGSKLILDDPHSAADAHSDKNTESALRWFREVWTNRLNDQNKDAMVTVGQRIRENDVCGYIIKERPDWIHVDLPAFYEPSRHCTTPIWTDWRKEENELLWPERFSQHALDGLRRDLGSIGFAAQYQQSPVPSGGGTFKKHWLRYYSIEPDQYVMEAPDGVKRVLTEKCRKFITVDLAISQKQSADYTVISVWAVTPERELLLIDCVRDHFDNPEQQKQIQLMYQRHKPGYIQIESVAYQLAIIQQLWRLGLPVREYKPVRDKVSRASTASVFYEAGRVYHPQGASWLHEWESELLMFPMAEHDDMVDTVSMACDAISGPASSADDHIEAMKQRLAKMRGAHV
jgi:predicted phage terminase large subunit-like protein